MVIPTFFLLEELVTEERCEQIIRRRALKVARMIERKLIDKTDNFETMVSCGLFCGK